MVFVYRFLFPAMWTGWALSWWALSVNVKATIRRESVLSRCLYVGPLIVAVFLLWGPSLPLSLLRLRFLPQTVWTFWVGSILTATGLVFAVWARMHLGANWSGTITIKKDHELITSGPYAIVRHPIYAGILLAFMGSATACGEFRGIPAIVLVFWALLYKLRREERWMREQFREAYEVYSRRVAALIPLPAFPAYLFGVHLNKDENQRSR